MIRKYLLAALLGFLYSGFLIAQSLSNPLSVQFKSPQVSNIEKVGLVPTNLSTGQINPSIAIGSLSTPQLDIPVSLNYSNNGLRIGENATWVGWGWNIFVGGVISQNVKGIADDASGGLLYASSNNDLFRFLNNQMNTTERDLYILNVSQQQEDAERDIFTFNFMGRSGSFYFDANGVIHQFLRSDLKISFTLSNYSLTSFSITDERGFIYLFNVKEVSSFSEMEVTENFPVVVGGNSWYLSSITTTNNDVISFTYEDDITFTDVHNSYTLSFGARGNSSGCAVNYNMNDVSINSAYPVASQKKLKEITTGYGKIIFNTQRIREDLKDVNGQKGNALTEIMIQNNNGKIVKKASFAYEHFLDGSNQAKNRLKLKNLSICAGNCSSPLTYQFSYFNESSSFPPLQSASKDFDHWGFYNGAGNSSQLPTFNGALISPYVGYYYGGDKNAKSLYSRFGMLKTIKYPTGGTTEFEYEGNIIDFSGYSGSAQPVFVNPNPNTDLTKYEVGGNRIKKIINTDPVSGSQNSLFYDYSTENILKYVPNYLCTKEYFIEIATSSYSSCGNDYFVSDRPQNAIPGPAVEYSYAVEKNDLGGALGYKKISFSKSDDIGSQSQPFPTIINTGWRAGQPVQTDVYKGLGSNQFSQVEKSTNLFLTSTYTPMTIGLNSVRISRRIVGIASTNPATIPYYETGLYSYFTEQTKLTQSSKTEYDGSRELTVTGAYSYESSDHIQKTKETVSNSKNETKTLVYKYPHDFGSTAPYQQMVTRNIINPVIEQLESNTTLTQEMSRIKTNFQLWSNSSMILPTVIDRSFKGASYETEATVNQYDYKGNVQQVTGKDGVIISYLWGYNAQYPVAKVTGASYTAIAGFINQNILDNSSGSYNDQQMRDELNKIRTGLAGTKAMVQTYTYIPQVGVSSETDPNGHTSYYEYDDYNRLGLIRDQDKNIIKRICYNYAGQTEACTCINSDADWQNTTTSLRCQTNNGQNTGYQEQEQKDNNSCSPTYNQTRWVVAGYNSTVCSITPVCNNCPADGHKCINGNCETGIRICTESYYDYSMGEYRNTFHYEFSDGSWTNDYVEYSSCNCAGTECL